MGRPASRCGGAGECCGALARPAEAWTEVLCIFVGGSFEEVFLRTARPQPAGPKTFGGLGQCYFGVRGTGRGGETLCIFQGDVPTL